MKALVVYDSEFGNTAKIARAIADQLEKSGTVQLASVGGEATVDLTGVDLMVVGGPTQGFSARPVLRGWVDGLPKAALSAIAVATFDTRFRWPSILSGSAAYRIGKKFERGGVRVIVEPESFFVTSEEGPLVNGELERAAAWADTLATKVVASAERVAPA